MNVVLKDSYKADVFSFDIERNGGILNLTVNNVISWEYLKMKFTKDELRGLADFIHQFLNSN